MPCDRRSQAHVVVRIRGGVDVRQWNDLLRQVAKLGSDQRGFVGADPSADTGICQHSLELVDLFGRADERELIFEPCFDQSPRRAPLAEGRRNQDIRIKEEMASSPVSLRPARLRATTGIDPAGL